VISAVCTDVLSTIEVEGKKQDKHSIGTRVELLVI
jgi:hypothetical protein